MEKPIWKKFFWTKIAIILLFSGCISSEIKRIQEENKKRQEDEIKFFDSFKEAKVEKIEKDYNRLSITFSDGRKIDVTHSKYSLSVKSSKP